jgi:tetratricopeptide (TPR) repeat protein
VGAQLPNDAVTLRERAATERKLFRPLEALLDLDHALALQPNNPATFYERGVTQHMLRKHKEALANLEQASF